MKESLRHHFWTDRKEEREREREKRLFCKLSPSLIPSAFSLCFFQQGVLDEKKKKFKGGLPHIKYHFSRQEKKIKECFCTFLFKKKLKEGFDKRNITFVFFKKS